MITNISKYTNNILKDEDHFLYMLCSKVLSLWYKIGFTIYGIL